MRFKTNVSSIALILWFVVMGLVGCGGGGTYDVAPPEEQPDVRISLSPGNSRVWVGQTQQFSAFVENTTNHAVTWEVEGVGCAAPACGTIDTSGMYTAPATLTVSEVIVRGTSVADPTKSATAALLLLGPALNRLQGQYAFLLRGFMSSGEAMQMGGVFTADGNGVVSGVRDAVLQSTVVSQQAFTGDYTLSTENRGHITIGPSGSSLVFSFVLNGAGDRGYVIGFDNGDTRTAGVLIKQNPSAFSSASLVGDYAFLLAGERAAVGHFHLDANGGLAGNTSFIHGGDWIAYGAPVDGSYENYLNGIGEVDINFHFGAAHCRVYVVDANTMLWLSLDPQGSAFGLVSGEVARQSGGPFDNSVFNGAYILAMNGAVFQSSVTHSTAGRLVLDGTGMMTGAFDYNDHGTVQLNVPVTNTGGSSYYGISAEGFVAGDLNARPFHGVLISPDRAFLLTEYAFDHNGFLTGFLERQTGGPFDNTSPAGSSAYGMLAFSSNAAPLLQCGVARLDGSGSLSLIEDENALGQPIPDGQSTASYSVSAEGRFTAESIVGYEMSPSKLVIFNADPQDSTPQFLQAEK